MELRRQSENPQILRLPPPEMRRFVPGKDELIPTPLDERGLVDTDKLIAHVLDTLEPEYAWPLDGKINAHHLYWERNRYTAGSYDTINPEVFRNLPINQIIVPTEFHDWLHLITREPEVPSREAMKHLIDAYRAGQKLSRYARQSIELTRARYIREERLERGRERNLWEFLVELEEAKKIPFEFQPIDFDNLDPSSSEELHFMAKTLGKAIAKANRTRDIKRSLGSSSLVGANATLIL